MYIYHITLNISQISNVATDLKLTFFSCTPYKKQCLPFQNYTYVEYIIWPVVVLFS
jgi:hypothetical protein